MPRKGPARKREITPDPVYNNRVVARFINRMFTRGKKSVGEKIFYTALDEIEAKTGKPGIETFEQAIRNVMPIIEVKPRGSAVRPAHGPRHQMAGHLCKTQTGQNHGRQALGRTHGRGQRSRRFHQEERRRPQDGRGEQGVRALQVVIAD